VNFVGCQLGAVHKNVSPGRVGWVDHSFGCIPASPYRLPGSHILTAFTRNRWQIETNEVKTALKCLNMFSGRSNKRGNQPAKWPRIQDYMDTRIQAGT